MYRSVRKRGSGCFCPTFVQVSTSSILCGKCLRPIQDGHVREAPLEKVVRRGKTKAPSSNYNNRTILLYCRHLGDSRNLEGSPPELIRLPGRFCCFHDEAKQIRSLQAPSFILRTHRHELRSAMAKGPSTNIRKFHKVVKSSQNIVVIAGAGLSAASGDRSSELFRSPFTPFTNPHL